jgi:hypothetical protein
MSFLLPDLVKTDEANYICRSMKTQQSGSKIVLWFKRVGMIGFLFFLVKGLIWLGLFAWLGADIFK